MKVKNEKGVKVTSGVISVICSTLILLVMVGVGIQKLGWWFAVLSLAIIIFIIIVLIFLHGAKRLTEYEDQRRELLDDQ